MPRLAWIVLPVLFLSPFGAFAGTLPVDQASSHVGEPGTVCGLVASANYAIKARGQPTFLNLNKPDPQQVFTVVIWVSDWTKFGTPEKQLADKNICATGVIQLFRGRPEIILHEPMELTQQ